MNSVYSELRAKYLEEWRIWYRMNWVCEHNSAYYVETQVCKEWQGPDGFINWLDHIGPRPKNCVQDRIDKFADYEPGNVKWTSKVESQNNERRHSSEERCYWGKIARDNNIKKATYYRRVRAGWNLKDAATLPISQIRYKRRIV